VRTIGSPPPESIIKIPSKTLCLSSMVNRELQDETVRRVEDIFSSYKPEQAELILGELSSLGFVRVGGNPAAVSMENEGMEIFVLAGLDEKGRLVSHEIRRFDEIRK
jgi:hypothetical protein